MNLVSGFDLKILWLLKILLLKRMDFSIWIRKTSWLIFTIVTVQRILVDLRSERKKTTKAGHLNELKYNKLIFVSAA